MSHTQTCHRHKHVILLAGTGHVSSSLWITHCTHCTTPQPQTILEIRKDSRKRGYMSVRLNVHVHLRIHTHAHTHSNASRLSGSETILESLGGKQNKKKSHSPTAWSTSDLKKGISSVLQHDAVCWSVLFRIESGEGHLLRVAECLALSFSLSLPLSLQRLNIIIFTPPSHTHNLSPALCLNPSLSVFPHLSAAIRHHPPDPLLCPWESAPAHPYFFLFSKVCISWRYFKGKKILIQWSFFLEVFTS